MKKILCFALVIAFLLSFAGCGPGNDNIPTQPGQYVAYYRMPENAITALPEKMLLDWDIKSVRDPYANIDIDKDYSMPVYKIDTYEEYLHLIDILGDGIAPEKAPAVDEDAMTIEYFDYRRHTFDNYSLILGWVTLETVHKLECYNDLTEYTANIEQTQGGKRLTVCFDKNDDCGCLGEESNALSFLVWVSVPKEMIVDISKFAFILKDCLGTAEQAAVGESKE